MLEQCQGRNTDCPFRELLIEVPMLHKILLQLLQSLLNKVSGESPGPGMVSSTLLLLALRTTYSTVPDRSDIMGKRFVDFTVLSQLHNLRPFTFNVMSNMKTRFEADALTSEQKVKATKVITETHAKLGTFSFNVLGLEQGDRTNQEVFAMLNEYKESGNLTSEQNTSMQDLAQDTQILMIQGIINILNYTALLELPAFGSTISTTVEEANLEELDFLTTSPRAFTTTCFFQTPRPGMVSSTLLHLALRTTYSTVPDRLDIMGETFVDFTVLSHLPNLRPFTFDMMSDMKTRFEVDALTSEQKVEATKVITEAHAKLGTFSFNVLGLE